MERAKVVFDAKGVAVGRLGTQVCKELLKGKEVFVINSEEAIVSGSMEGITSTIRRKRKMGVGASLKGPKYPRVADRLVKRMLRGMLPRDKSRGQEAYKRLKCYVGNGELKENDLKNVKKIEQLMPRDFCTIKDVVEALK